MSHTDILAADNYLLKDSLDWSCGQKGTDFLTWHLHLLSSCYSVSLNLADFLCLSHTTPWLENIGGLLSSRDRSTWGPAATWASASSDSSHFSSVSQLDKHSLFEMYCCQKEMEKQEITKPQGDEK